MKIQTKFILLFLGFALGLISLLMGSIFYFTQRYAFEDFYKRLEARVNIGAEVYMQEDEQTIFDYRRVRNRYLEKLPAESDFFFRVQNGKVVPKPGAPKLPSSFFNAILSEGKSRYNDHNDFFAGKLFSSDKGDFIVVVYARDPSGFRELAMLQKILLTGFVISVLIVYFIGKIFSQRIFRPFAQINRKVKEITADNLHLRLPIGNEKDEVAEITTTFNDMLDRLETAFDTQSNFISNASHELRTPISIIFGEAELALKTEDSTQQKQSFQIIVSEADKLQQIISGLLYLAKTAYDRNKQPKELVRMDQLLLNIKGVTDQVNPRCKLILEFNQLPEDEKEITVEGYEHLLQLAIANIITNACKYSDNKPVSILLKTSNKHIVISVSDEGIGIPEDEKKYIFEPFFRASNTHLYEGHGVGLPLAQKIIRLHRGTIDIRTSVGTGTDIKVILPSIANI
ncbi:sensor histidine kinase [Olivibacter domesticus]|uniref:histidine kinase n=1 Tax=Olivibacter domesticus TaxID=407022 RepID=A0A1H7LHC5_OLID1|nr:HAMP domain-containing sensor histidine kinase [Olivibacter domesticus]SEK98341.1 Signal transduction histidine kinase [Olivibacter domesticus]